MHGFGFATGAARGSSQGCVYVRGANASNAEGMESGAAGGFPHQFLAGRYTFDALSTHFVPHAEG